MPQHKATLLWTRGDQPFLDNCYTRAHQWFFDGGLTIPASSSPSVVPLPYSDPAAIDPEEAFVASLSSCHMLWFLSLAAKKQYCVDSYQDEAIGDMKKNDQGQFFIATVVLQPKVVFSGDKLPSSEEELGLHEEAHRLCFIANSVRSEVRYEPRS